MNLQYQTKVPYWKYITKEKLLTAFNQLSKISSDLIVLTNIHGVHQNAFVKEKNKSFCYHTQSRVQYIIVIVVYFLVIIFQIIFCDIF